MVRPIRFQSTLADQHKAAAPTSAGLDAETRPVAQYEGPLAKTFTRLKLFSLGSLALASTLTPILLLAPGEISMAGRVGLCLTALSTSGVSTALIAWIGQPYAGRMQLLLAPSRTSAPGQGKEDVSPTIRIETVSWKLRPLVTTVYQPSFLRATSRPFATWELTNTPPPLPSAGRVNGEDAKVTQLVSETVDAKTGKVVGRWVVKYDVGAPAEANGERKIVGRCEVEGKPVRYFNVHEELLDDEWRVLN